MADTVGQESYYDPILSPILDQQVAAEKRKKVMQALMTAPGPQVPLQNYGAGNALSDIFRTVAGAVGSRRADSRELAARTQFQQAVPGRMADLQSDPTNRQKIAMAMASPDSGVRAVATKMMTDLEDKPSEYASSPDEKSPTGYSWQKKAIGAPATPPFTALPDSSSPSGYRFAPKLVGGAAAPPAPPAPQWTPTPDARSPTGVSLTRKREGVAVVPSAVGGGIVAYDTMDDASKETLAAQLRQSGKMPEGYTRIPQATMDITVRASKQAAAEGNTAEAEALQRVANRQAQPALADITKRQTQLEVNSKSAEANFKTLEGLAAKVDRTGSPLINQLKQVWQSKAIQDPDLKALKAALMESTTEYAKVITGQTTGQAVTDAASAKAAELVAATDSPESFAAALDTMRAMIQNRRGSYENQRQTLLKSLAPKTAAIPAPAAAPVGKDYSKMTDDQIKKELGL